MNEKIKYIDLFCGIGSFHYSFSKNDWDCVMACDISKPAKDTYEQNYNMTPKHDICDIEPKNVEKYDILCAGFPCQPFSQAGKHKGFNDERGTMFFHVIKFIKFHKPKVIILENVSALLTHDGNKSFEKIMNELKKQQYDTTYKILKCSDYGIPQMRKRLFIVAFNKHTNFKKNIDKFFNLEKYENKNVTLKEYLNKNFEKKIAYTIRCGGKNSPINDRHNWDGYYVNGNEYRLTIDDGLKLQGFEDNFNLCGSVKDKWILLGNTIPIIFTKIIGEQLKKYL